MSDVCAVDLVCFDILQFGARICYDDTPISQVTVEHPISSANSP